MYTLNKVVWALTNPAFVGMAVLLLAIVFYKFKIVRICGLVFATLWLWIWSTPLLSVVVGGSLEYAFVITSAEGRERMREAGDYPVCDAIVDLGGGIEIHTNFYSGACLNSSADRAYFSSLLWRAGKAPVVIPSGVGCALSDGKFLEDLGIPESAIVADNDARNTEENAKFVNKILVQRIIDRKPRVLLVTSAWHMKRSLLMFEKYAPDVEVIPAPCDFECILDEDGFDIGWILPNFEVAGRNLVYLHEWVGYWWYKYFRK